MYSSVFDDPNNKAYFIRQTDSIAITFIDGQNFGLASVIPISNKSCPQALYAKDKIKLIFLKRALCRCR